MCDGDAAHAAARKVFQQIGNLLQPAGALLPSAKAGGVHDVIKAQAELTRTAHMPLKNVPVNLRQPVRRAPVPGDAGPVRAVNFREARAAVRPVERNQFAQQRVAPGRCNRKLQRREIFRRGHASIRMGCGEFIFRQIHGLDGIPALTGVNSKTGGVVCAAPGHCEGTPNSCGSGPA